ncbi:MAG TPA: fructosamine kinase family protein [Gammaproteobacteria bacterium]|nr:fructosamine kinase family protein [Gammaproteobacteria bacterium]
MPDWHAISQQVQATSGTILATDSARPVGGGCINAAYVLTGSQDGNPQNFFIKTNRADNLSMFEAEAEGLHALRSSHSLRVPAPVCSGIAGGNAYLVLEHIALKGTGDDTQQGNRLAAMHQTRHPQFGWHRHNTIGSTPQLNRWTDSWVTFWSEQRLGAQLELAGQNGAKHSLLRRGDRLQAALPAFFDDYQPAPSLLHGDLWSGNAAFDEQGQPVIFDPAVYFGDRETDLAMTELFGGFSAAFYAAYNATWPLDAGYATRKTLYNLYHILNHFNLFGGGYESQAQGMIDRLLSECH